MLFNLGDVRAGQPQRFESLSAFPLFSDRNHGTEYLLSDEAIESEWLSVEEVSERGSVSEVLVQNKGNTRVLFLEGEELIGAKQNRVLNTSILIGGKTKTRVPVSCVEQGRWRCRRQGFSCSGKHSPSKLRYALKAGVAESLAARRTHRSNQAQVWNEVAKYDAAHAVGSPTGAMSDIFAALANRAGEAKKRLPYVEGATGVAIALGPRVVAVELFDKPATCRKVWERVLSGFILDALEDQPAEKLAGQADVQRLLKATKDAEWNQVHPVGEGEEYRAKISADYASALCLDQQLVHASVICRGREAGR